MIKIGSGTCTMEGELLELEAETTIVLLGFWRNVREQLGESVADEAIDRIVRSVRRQDYKELILKEKVEVE